LKPLRTNTRNTALEAAETARSTDVVGVVLMRAILVRGAVESGCCGRVGVDLVRRDAGR
jgi:hypothetical protein